MELLARLEAWPWLIPAASDFVALGAATAVAVLIRSRRVSVPKAAPAIPLRETQATADVYKKSVEPITPAPAPGETPARADVKRALAAIGHWENHYGGARGITELARWVDGQKPSREKAKTS